MAEKRKIKQGESLLELAYEGGFDSWKTVWNDEANAELRELRSDPQVLLPGDEITVPEREVAPKESCPVDKVHRFRLVRPRAWVNLRMLDQYGEPVAGARFAVTVDGREHNGQTDSGGMISVEVTPTAHDGHLMLWLEDSGEVFESPIQVGFLDPASSWSGTRGRLINLGLRTAGHDSLPDNRTDLSHPLNILGLAIPPTADPTEHLQRIHDKGDPQ